jgi:hypothetical protein
MTFRLTSTNCIVQQETNALVLGLPAVILPLCEAKWFKTTVLDLFPGRVYVRGCLLGPTGYGALSVTQLNFSVCCP